jgi:hypothetical protein
MIQITQNATTNIGLSGFIFPIGTVFTGFLTITEDGLKDSASYLNCSYKWYIDDALQPTNGLNLPYGTGILIDAENEAKFIEALLINTTLCVGNINNSYPNLSGNINIIL